MDTSKPNKNCLKCYGVGWVLPGGDIGPCLLCWDYKYQTGRTPLSRTTLLEIINCFYIVSDNADYPFDAFGADFVRFLQEHDFMSGIENDYEDFDYLFEEEE